MTVTVQRWLSDELAAIGDGSILVAGEVDIDTPGGATDIYAIDRLADVNALDGRRYDLAIVRLEPDNSDWLGTSHALGRLQHMLADRVLAIMAQGASEEVRRNLLAQGFRLAESCADALVYGYSVTTYNEPRTWNSAEHWAHPDNFDKRRW